MADKNIGSLVVLVDDQIVGIITERHYARQVILEGKSSPETPVRDIMTAPVVCARTDQTISECMAVMTEKRLRHLPVVDKKRLVGLVSIGDLVKSTIADQDFTIEQLIHYIQG
jgi:CBS domain-containing protein